MPDPELTTSLELVSSYLVELSAGALVEAIRLRERESPKEGHPEQERHLRIERIEARFKSLFTEAVRRVAPRLTDPVLEVVIRFLSDVVVQAEMIGIFFAAQDVQPSRPINRLKALLDQYDLPDSGRDVLSALLESLVHALYQVCEDPQLAFLREMPDRTRVQSKLASLAADSTRFNDAFIQLKRRKARALRRMALSPAAPTGLFTTVQHLLQERLGAAPLRPEVDRPMERYLQFVVNSCSRVSLWSIKADRPLTADLERVYVNLSTQPRAGRGPEARDLVREILDAPPGRQSIRRALSRGVEMDAEQAPGALIGIHQALKEHDKLVIVGAPGSGKTTLLRYLALTYARDRAAERLELDETRVPIFVRLADFNRHLLTLGSPASSPKALLEYISVSWGRSGVDLQLPADFFREPLEKGHCVLLLDGVDEVPTGPERSHVAQTLVAFLGQFARNRFVITSRPHGFTGQARDKLGQHCSDCVIQEFRDEDIQSFIRAWYEATVLSDLGDTPESLAQAERQAADLIEAIRDRPQIRLLARTPLLLSVLAAVHYRHVRLPERRVEVYNECVEFLLGYWDELKDRDAEASRDLATLGGKDRAWKRKFIAPIALRFHDRELETASLDLFQDLLTEPLGDPRQPEIQEQARSMLRIIEERSGLFQEVSPGRFRFSHLTFQEYLAAWQLAEDVDPSKGLAGRIGEDWWKEVVLLEAAHLSATSANKLSHFIGQMEKAGQESGRDHLSLAWAARCLVDCTRQHTGWKLWEETTGKLVKMLDDPSLQVDVRLRIEAGNALGQMEDPRLKRDMVRIPAGEFLMGTPPEAIDQIWEMFKGTGFEKKWLEWETPQRTVYLDAFEIDRYPVTNAEYKAFVDVKGHRPPPHWQGKDYPSDKANHPVVNVSWLDAKAYADWAGKRLPTEAEWERAARGSDGRLWPWGDDWKEDHCNSEEAGVGDTTPVGIFPKGRRQEEGTEDMAGNVWEWCADWFAEDAYRSGKRENPVGPDRGDYRVLRGGSFYSSKGWVRCAYRLGFDPPFRINYYAGFRCAR